uniref:Uncharacterized protein n=1 Tax=Cryptococcus bacillisporus CA1280 TaxID=1296109 RepID=A0A0D0VRH8_CRYGA|nr:hypothetical protein I312_01170 [Cryptococcus bacillisporus CA1280]
MTISDIHDISDASIAKDAKDANNVNNNGSSSSSIKGNVKSSGDINDITLCPYVNPYPSRLPTNIPPIPFDTFERPTSNDLHCMAHTDHKSYSHRNTNADLSSQTQATQS